MQKEHVKLIIKDLLDNFDKWNQESSTIKRKIVLGNNTIYYEIDEYGRMVVRFSGENSANHYVKPPYLLRRRIRAAQMHWKNRLLDRALERLGV